jgi:DNA helicase-2/ATP-dependent DNA helicase PcrA
LDGLNEVQRAAVLHGEGPLLLLAGAGSGKTRVVTHRIARLLREGVPPSSIVALTFTNRAAREMRERVAALLGGELDPALTLSTFHALGARFLRRHAQALGRTRSFTIYDDKDQIEVVQRALAEVGAGEHVALARRVREAIDKAKNAGRAVDPADLPPEVLVNGGADVALAYERLLERADAFDFGDLIVRPAELLATYPDLAAEYRDRWRWFLVDEFQDTNPAQYQWLRLLAPPGSNLVVVGDDDQSIYGWRGAEVSNILDFPHDYGGAEVVRLEQNYRSTGHILAAANAVIGHNKRRLGKSLWTDHGDGMRLELYEAATGRDEGRWVAERIRALCQEDAFRPGDCAVLFRTNSLTLDIEEALRAARLPYAVVRGRSFYERAEVKDALAYVRLLVNPSDDVAFRRAVGSPPRGVGDKSLERLEAAASARGTSLWGAVEPALEAGEVRGKAASGLRELVAVIEARRDEGPLPSVRVRDALEASGLLPELRARGESRDPDEPARLENVERLLEAIEEYERTNAAPTLAGFLEQVKLVSDVDGLEMEQGAVSLMTVHAAKGLEFRAVFVVGLEAGIFPHDRSLRAGGDALEEERRLCYVALTRARERLFLSRARSRRAFARRAYGWDGPANPPSPFLAELPARAVESRVVPEAPPPPRRARDWDDDEAPYVRRRARPAFADEGEGEGVRYRPGMSVWHAQFGAGRVVAVSGGADPRLTIAFPDLGERTIVARFVSPYEP